MSGLSDKMDNQNLLNIERGTLTVAILLFFFTIIGSLQVGAVSQYEISIYAGFGIVQYFLTATYVAGIVVVLISLYTGSKYWKKGLAIVYATYAILFFWPVFRGYTLYGRGGADVLAHIGYTKTLLQTGEITGSVSNPLFYYLMGTLRLIGLDYDVITALLGLIFFLLYIGGSVLIITWMERTRHRLILCLTLASPLLFTTFHMSSHPAVLSFFLVPTGYALYRRAKISGRFRDNFATILISVAIVLFHPITGGLFLAIVVTGDISDHLAHRINHERPSMKPTSQGHTLLLILMMVIGGWYLYRYNHNPVVLAILALFTNQISSGAAASTAVNSLENQPVWRIIQRFIELYGSQFSYFVAAGISMVVVLKDLVQRQVSPFQFELFLHMIVSGAIAIIFLTLNLVISDPIRVSRYLIMASFLTVLLVSIQYYNRNREIIVVGVAVIVIFSGAIAISSVYQPNNHLTNTEKSGTEWLIDYENPEIITVSAHSSYKLEMYIEGAASERESHRLYQPNDDRYRVPPHFGYPSHSSVSDSINYPSYIVTKTYDVEFYRWYPESIQDDYITYTESDLRQLQSDQAASQVYTNGNFTVYRNSG